jgi:hypothetical protein
MEKIYMENNQNQKQTRQTKKTFNMLNVTVGLSFAIAFIAVASILLVVAFKPSYSYESLETLPDSVKAQTIDKHLKGNGASDSTFLFMLQYGNDNKTSRGICLEYPVGYGGNGASLNKDGSIDDVGLIYLIQRLDEIGARIESDYSSNGNFGCSGNTCSKEDIAAWVKQNAVWAYQAQKLGGSQPDVYGQTTDPNGRTSGTNLPNYVDYSGIQNSTVVERSDIPSSEKYTCPGGDTWFNHYGVSAAVSEALTKEGTLADVSINLSVANEGNSQWTESGDFYRTGKINVETLGASSSSVAASLNGIDNAKLYGCPSSGDCSEIKDLTNISLASYDHFRIYVPKDAVSTEKKNVTLVFNYKFEVISGYYYKANGHQTVTMLGTLPKEVSKGLDFSIVKVPDTATDISGTIYIVGLIVLLSGLGILYINVRKQKTQTQQ